MATILVTGGSGRLGRFVCKALAAEHSVTVFDRQSTPDQATILGDIRDVHAVEGAATHCDAIVHLAGIPSPRNAADDQIISTNVLGAWCVLEAALRLRVQRVLLCSSDFVTGLLHRGPEAVPLYLPVDEDYPLAPIDAYGLSKQLAEEAAAAYIRRGLDVVILRPGLVVFPGSESEALTAGDKVDNPDLWWYASAGDVADAFRLALAPASLSARTFFIGAPDTLARTPTLDLVQRRYGKLLEIRDPALYRDNPYASIFDTSLARRLLGFHHQRNWRTWPGARA